jgi:hypothetical protein
MDTSIDRNTFTDERAIVPSSSGVDTPLVSYSVLGSDSTTGELVTIEQEQRLKGIYIIGKTGTGKTTLKVNLILQDIAQGMGVCFITPHGDAITDILKRLPKDREQDVILLDPMDKTHAFGLNLVQCHSPQDHEEVSRVISGVIEIFEKLFTQSGDLMKEAPNMAETLQMALPVLIAHRHPRMTLAEIPLLTMDQTARMKLLAPVTNLMVKSFWQTYQTWKSDRQDELTSSTRKRVNDFTLNPLILEIIGQSETTLDFRKIMDERKILLVKLPRKPEIVASLIGSVLISQIATAAFSREDTPEDERVPFMLYADEYQRFSTPTFAELLTEVRKYKIATCVAHQARGQLDQANKVATLNAGTIIVYQVSGDDAKELAPNYQRTPPPPEVEWIEEEVGTKPVEVYKRDVVNHLLKQGYVDRQGREDERVMQFVRTYLQPLALATEKYTSTWFGSSDGSSVHKFTGRQAFVDINTWLYEGMVNSDKLFQLLPESFLWLLQLLISSKIVDHGNPFYDFWYRFQVIDRFEGEKKIEIVRPATEKMQEEYARLTKQLREAVLTLLPQQPEDFHVHRSSLFLQPQFSWLYRDAVEKRSLYDAKQAVSRELDEWDRKKSGSGWRWTGEMNGSAYVVEPNLPPGEYERMLAKYQQSSKEAIEKGYSLFEKFTEAAQLCQYALWQNPLKTMDSGLREPDIRKHPVITQRSYPEMESLIADKLANPPLPFAAHVKLGTQEYTIQALPFREPDADAVWMAREKRIIEQTHKGYCKERTEVDTEIKARQDALRQRVSQVAQTTSDENEE